MARTKTNTHSPLKQVQSKLSDFALGYELNESWEEAKKNTQHRPGRH